MMQSCAEAVLKGVHGAFTRIWMVEPGTDTLVLCTSVGLYTDLDGEHARVRVGEHKLGRIAETRCPHRNEFASGGAWSGHRSGPRQQGLLSFAVTLWWSRTGWPALS